MATTMMPRTVPRMGARGDPPSSLASALAAAGASGFGAGSAFTAADTLLSDVSQGMWEDRLSQRECCTDVRMIANAECIWLGGCYAHRLADSSRLGQLGKPCAGA